MKGKYKYINDKYTKARGGESHIYRIACSFCNSFLFLYQKDGIGTLYRFYLDRIISSPEFIYPDVADISGIPALKCPNCDHVLAVPMIYAPEKRPAYRILRGTIAKKVIQ